MNRLNDASKLTWFLRTILVIGALGVLSVAAQARPAYVAILLSTYPDHQNTLKQFGCLNCHISSNGGPRNPYGLAIDKAFKASGDDDVSSDTIKAVETQSATPGGPTFLSLINAGQNPGAPAAAPAPAPAAATKTTAPATSKTSAVKPAAPAKTGSSSTATTSKMTSSTSSTKPGASSSTAAGKPTTATTSASTAKPATATTSAAPATTATTSTSAAPSTESSASSSTSTSSGSSGGNPPKAPFGIPDYAFHPAIVHFPIALFIAGWLLDAIGFLRKDKNLLIAGWFNLALAAASSLAAVASGLAALIFMGMSLQGTVLTHMLLALLTTVMMWAMFGLRAYRHEKMTAPARVAYYVLAVVTLVTISYVGHLGGQLVYG